MVWSSPFWQLHLLQIFPVSYLLSSWTSKQVILGFHANKIHWLNEIWETWLQSKSLWKGTWVAVGTRVRLKTGFYGTGVWVLACPLYRWAKTENTRIKIGPSRYISVLEEAGWHTFSSFYRLNILRPIKYLMWCPKCLYPDSLNLQLFSNFPLMSFVSMVVNAVLMQYL